MTSRAEQENLEMFMDHLRQAILDFRFLLLVHKNDIEPRDKVEYTVCQGARARSPGHETRNLVSQFEFCDVRDEHVGGTIDHSPPQVRNIWRTHFKGVAIKARLRPASPGLHAPLSSSWNSLFRYSQLHVAYIKSPKKVFVRCLVNFVHAVA